MKKFSVCAVLTLCLLGLSGAIAQADVAAEREKTMKEVGASMKALAEIAKGAPYDAALVKKNASSMAANFEIFGSLFEAGTETASKSSSPEIWTDRAGFEKVRQDAMAAATALADSDEAGFKDAFQSVAASCKSCHSKFRISN